MRVHGLFRALITRKADQGKGFNGRILPYLSVVQIIPNKDTLIDIIAYCCNSFLIGHGSNFSGSLEDSYHVRLSGL